MKVEVEIGIVKGEPPHFPALYENIDRGYVVMFCSAHAGTVVFDPNRVHGVGNYDDSWVPCYQRSHWTRLPAGSKVTLTQE